MAPLSKTILPVATEEAAERRGGIRYQITVSAEVIEVKSNTRFSARTTDLGPGGCFVDTLMPLPVGSDVRVRLHKENMAIEALGTVSYSQTGLGMGIAFNEMPPPKQRALDAWLAELTYIAAGSPETYHAAHSIQPRSEAGSDAVRRLLRLLVKRGIIAESDARDILREPLS